MLQRKWIDIGLMPITENCYNPDFDSIRGKNRPQRLAGIVRKCAVYIRQRKVEALKIAALLLENFLFGAWRQKSGYDKQHHDGIGIVLEGFMSRLVFKKVVQLKFVIDFKDSNVAEVFSVKSTLGELFIHVYGQCKLLLHDFFLGHLAGDRFEMANRIIEFLFQFIQIAPPKHYAARDSGFLY